MTQDRRTWKSEKKSRECEIVNKRKQRLYTSISGISNYLYLTEGSDLQQHWQPPKTAIMTSAEITTNGAQSQKYG